MLPTAGLTLLVMNTLGLAALTIIPSMPLPPDDGSGSTRYEISATAGLVSGAAQEDAVRETTRGRTDPVVQQALADQGLAPAPVWDCVVRFPIDEHRYTCVVDAGAANGTMMRVIDTRDDTPIYADAPQQIVVTWSDVASLPIETGTINPQVSADSPHLILVETPTLSTAAEHTLTMTLLGVPVEIRLTPIQWEWDFGQESVPNMTTRTPGGHWPDLTVAPIYQDVAQDITISATITWEGEFRVAGTDTWLPVFGRGTTTATSDPFSLREYRVYLLHDPNQPDPTPDW